MTFICANCRKKLDPHCPICVNVGLAIANMPDPLPLYITVAPEEPQPKIIRKRRFSWELESNKNQSKEYHEEYYTYYGKDYSGHGDEYVTFDIFNDFTVSYEARAYMKNQIELEFYNAPDLDVMPDIDAFHWKNWRGIKRKLT